MTLYFPRLSKSWMNVTGIQNQFNVNLNFLNQYTHRLQSLWKKYEPMQSIHLMSRDRESNKLVTLKDGYQQIISDLSGTDSESVSLILMLETRNASGKTTNSTFFSNRLSMSHHGCIFNSKWRYGLQMSPPILSDALKQSKYFVVVEAETIQNTNATEMFNKLQHLMIEDKEPCFLV